MDLGQTEWTTRCAKITFKPMPWLGARKFSCAKIYRRFIFTVGPMYLKLTYLIMNTFLDMLQNCGRHQGLNFYLVWHRVWNFTSDTNHVHAHGHGQGTYPQVWGSKFKHIPDLTTILTTIIVTFTGGKATGSTGGTSFSGGVATLSVWSLWVWSATLRHW